ncbi:unnamed protein product [Orchesella dallaii]|uniref:Carrier domain-containing protein n=1 Tax=Orchesella dallaii TaxID=48710 RepID=A0ABP1QI96_9HEXA
MIVRMLKSKISSRTVSTVSSVEPTDILVEVEGPDHDEGKLHRLLEGPVRSFPGNASLAQYFSVGFVEGRISEGQVAIIHDEKRFTFKDIEETSTRLAEVIKESVKNTKNLNPDNDSVIAVCLPPSEKLIFVLFAIHKIGATYVPIDVSFPEDRVFKIVKDCKPLLIISDHQTKYVGKFGIVKEQNKVVTVQDLLTQVAEKSSETEAGPASTSSKLAFSPLPGLPIVAERAAIILYTSGSSGEPKGVRLGHRAVMNRLSWQWQEFPYTPDEVCAFKTSLTFVDSVPEIFGPLLQGYPIVIFEKHVVSEPPIFMEKLSLHKITRVTLVPSLLRAIFQTLTLTDTAHGIGLLSTVKLWICSGEPLPFDLVSEFFELYPRRYTLANFYGSTEITGDVTYVAYNTREEAYKKVVEKKIPIGVPVHNTVIYVLDKEMNMAENGDVGEIYVAGYNLASNYVGGANPDKFVENSYTRTTAFKTLYRTGDYGRIGRTQDGTRMLFYEGRVDSQIKVRGQRIDLAEVELALSEIHLIQKVVVLCYRPGQEEQMILAYVVPLEPSVTIDRLEPMIAKRLRDYERPIIKFVDNIPLLVNGKTDRQRLLKMFEKQLNHKEEFEDWNTLDIPETKVHETKVLFRVMAEVTGTSVETLAENIDNSFFNVGGTSLNAVTVVVKLRAHHLFISLRDFVHAKNIRHILLAVSMMEEQVESEESLESASRADSHVTNRFSINALQETDKEEVLHTISYSFSKKGDLEAYTKSSYEEFRMMIESIWTELVSKGYSFVLRRAKDEKCIGVSLNFDVYDEPEKIEASQGIAYCLDMLEFIESRQRQKLPKGRGKLIHSFMMGTPDDVDEGESVAAVEAMEDHVLRMAHEKQFMGVLTTNTNPLTRQIDLDIHGYEVLNEYQVNKYIAPDGTKPFLMAPDSFVVVCCWKQIPGNQMDMF